jgi:hypothetical protein
MFTFLFSRSLISKHDVRKGNGQAVHTICVHEISIQLINELHANIPGWVHTCTDLVIYMYYGLCKIIVIETYISGVKQGVWEKIG